MSSASRIDTIALHAAPAANLRRLYVLRNITFVGQLAVLCEAYFGLHIVLPFTAMLAVIGLLSLLNLLTWLRLRKSWPVSDNELFAQLLLDVAELSALLYMSGGSSNPFISLYLLPLAISAATLPRAYNWVLAAATGLCYTLLLFFYWPLPHSHNAHGTDFNMHVYGMWFTFLLSAGLISYFVVGMSESLRRRDHLLAKAREAALRNEQIIALGTLAAGAAHELGTPLSTMAVIIHELALDHRDKPELGSALALLRDQVAACKRLLTQLLAKSAVMRADDGATLTVDAFLDDILAKWRLMRPEISVRYSAEGTEPAPLLSAGQTLSQAITNLLNNAADASPGSVEVHAEWTPAQLSIEIRDRGPGFSQSALGELGEAFFTTKSPDKGFGLGVFLSNATVNRYGGEVGVFNRAGGGACTRIVLPLTRPCEVRND